LKSKPFSSFTPFIFAALLITVVLLWGQFFYSRPSPNLNLYFLDVGQGDAIYIRTPTGEDALIDGGPDDSILQKLGEVMPPTDHEINLVILSHPHADHLKGLLEVLSRYKVDEILQTDVEYDSETFLTWQKQILDKQIPNHLARAGVERNLGEAKILILYPDDSFVGQKIDNLNNASVVSKVSYKNFAALLPGDLEKDKQAKLLETRQDFSAQVFKIPHHGSDTAANQPFLEAVSPKLAIISVGKDNKYGLPGQMIFEILKKINTQVLQTSQNGTIKVETDGEKFWVKEER
jgi:competence protein ComEC